jgi:hypothetical protein
MAGSTRTLLDIIEYAESMADIKAMLPVGGWGTENAIRMANDVATDFINQKFNWKWNRLKLPQFPTISWQQDYAQVGLTDLGWLERCDWVDINNTALPKPIAQVECVQNLPTTSYQYGYPIKIAWDYNQNLNQGVWPGANVVYINPIGQTSTPSNPMTNIIDASGNILVLTTYGTTGSTAPDAGADAPSGTTVTDGSVVWTVADPLEQGFRIISLPPLEGVVYLLRPVGQMRPPMFTATGNLLTPIPDDYSKYFEDGFIAYCHRMSANPAVKAQFEARKADWMQSMMDAKKTGDKEKQDYSFYPERGILSGTGPTIDLGAGAPYGNTWFGRGQ